jgi:hypothetical protein
MATSPKKGAKAAAPPPTAPPSRRKVDWDAVERDYSTGQFTDSELATKHGVSREAIVRRRTREQGQDRSRWTKDLGPHVRAATNALLMQELVTEKITADHTKVTGTVLAAAEVNKQVILGHRTDIKNLRDLTAGLMSELAQSALAAAEQDELAALLVTLQSGEVMTGDRLTKAQTLVRKSLELPGRIASAKALAETFTRLQLLERTAFGLDDKTPPEDPGTNGGKSLTDVERAVRLMHFLSRGGQQQ